MDFYTTLSFLQNHKIFNDQYEVINYENNNWKNNYYARDWDTY